MAASYKTYIRLARLHRPLPILLLLLPSWWGIALSSPGLPSLFLLFLFACGAILMRSAGCVYNDLVDQDLDAQVTRTASRPLSSKALSSKEAIVFLMSLLALSSLILLSLPFPVILTGVFALGLVLLYPWMKRITYWPQLFLGLTFNIGILMGWLCMNSTLSSVPLLFYGGAILWTIGYDTLYAFQDREDDLLAGIKSSALVVSSSPKTFLSIVYGSTLCVWGLGGLTAQLGAIYWLFLSTIGFHFFWQIYSLKENIPKNCLKRFESNIETGLLLFLGLVFSHLIN